MSVPKWAILNVFVILLMTVVVPPNMASAEPSDAQKLKLKATVVNHIKAHTTDNTYYFVSSENTKLMKLKFVAMHPVVFEHPDGTFVLCADFETAQHDKVLVDYFLTELNGRFVVLSSIEGKRSLLMSIAQRFGL